MTCRPGAQQKDELARVDRQIHGIVEAIKEGLRTPVMKDELLALENRKVELSTAVVSAPITAVRLHPNLAEIYRAKVARLHEELDSAELREEAAATLRSLIEEVRLVPVEGKLEIELFGRDSRPRKQQNPANFVRLAGFCIWLRGPATTFTEQL